MTYLEKYLSENPDASPEIVIEDKCAAELGATPFVDEHMVVCTNYLGSVEEGWCKRHWNTAVEQF